MEEKGRREEEGEFAGCRLQRPDSKIATVETQPRNFPSMRARRWPWVLAACFSAFLLALAFYFDAAGMAWVQTHQQPHLLAFMRGVSRWGDWPEHVILALIGAFVAYALGSRRWIMIFVAMVIACALAGMTNRVLKIATGRARPTVTQNAGFHGPRLASKYNSFPSGHTAASTAFFGVLLLARRRVGLALLPIPMLIAFSRFYLNAHHLSDVVAGAIVGALCALGTWYFLSRNMLDTRPRPNQFL